MKVIPSSVMRHLWRGVQGTGRNIRTGRPGPYTGVLPGEAGAPMPSGNKSRPVSTLPVWVEEMKGIMGAIELGVRRGFLEEVAHQPRTRARPRPRKQIWGGAFPASFVPRPRRPSLGLLWSHLG